MIARPAGCVYAISPLSPGDSPATANVTWKIDFFLKPLSQGYDSDRRAVRGAVRASSASLTSIVIMMTSVAIMIKPFATSLLFLSFFQNPLLASVPLLLCANVERLR